MKFTTSIVLLMIGLLMSGCGVRRHTTLAIPEVVTAVQTEVANDTQRNDIITGLNPTWEFVAFDNDTKVIELLQNTYVNREAFQYRCYLTLESTTYEGTPVTRITFESYPAFWGIRYLTCNYVLMRSNSNIAGLCLKKLGNVVPYQEKKLLQKLTN